MLTTMLTTTITTTMLTLEIKKMLKNRLVKWLAKYHYYFILKKNIQLERLRPEDLSEEDEGNDLELFDMMDEDVESPLDYIDEIIFLMETVQGFYWLFFYKKNNKILNCQGALQSTEEAYKKIYTTLTQKDAKLLKKCSDNLTKRRKKLEEKIKEKEEYEKNRKM